MTTTTAVDPGEPAATADRPAPTTTPPAPAHPAPPSLLGMALVSLAVLVLQVALTRVFSLLIWYHFAFLALALALLGFTAGGVLTQLRPALLAGDAPRRLGYGAGLFAALSVVALLVAARLPFGASVLASPGQFALFVLLIALCLAPFFAAGAVISLALAAHGASVSRLYFADLAGGGVGCALSVVAMDHLGGGAGGVLVAALAGALGGVAFLRRAAPGPARRRALALCLAVAAACGALLVVARDPLRDPLYLPNAKLYPRVPREAIRARHCTSLACVDFFTNPWHLGIWGLSRTYRGPLPEQVGVVIDAWALTSILAAERTPQGAPVLEHPVLEALPPSMVHQLDRATGRRVNEMLIIGAGGGVDVRTALHFGARHIEAVDINPVIIRGVERDYARFAGGLYAHPEVRALVSEGRHYLRRARHGYDLIQISGVDTYAASQAGAFALSENYLYTVEAFREYLAHLNPRGTLTMTRWLYVPERQTLRLCVIAQEAYRQAGLGDLAQRLVILGAPVPGAEMHFSVALFRREPFAREELRAVRELAAQRAFEVIYAPGDDAAAATPLGAPFAQYFRAPDREAFVRSYPFRIDATTDDAPFFFEHYRFARLLASRDAIFGAASGQLVLLVTFALVLASALLFVALPARLLARRRRGARDAPGAAPHAVAVSPAMAGYFLCLGLGFIAVEVALVPRFSLFLGHPVYALSVVLFALLTASGLGSALSPRLAGGRLSAAALAAAALIALEAVALPAVFDLALRLAFPARVALSLALIGAPAALMGTLFPGAVAARAPREPEARAGWIARAWVLNGYASVLGSVGAMIFAMAFGFRAVLLAAAAVYALASALLRRAPPSQT